MARQAKVVRYCVVCDEWFVGKTKTCSARCDRALQGDGHWCATCGLEVESHSELITHTETVHQRVLGKSN